MKFLAAFHQFSVITDIYVQHYCFQFQSCMFWCFLVQPRKLQHFPFFHGLYSIIKYHKFRFWYLYWDATIKKIFPCKSWIHIWYIEKVAQRDIGIFCRLMFVKQQLIIQYKGHIIFHFHVDRIFQCSHCQCLFILIHRSVHCIIKSQQCFFLFKNHAEYPIFVISCHTWNFCHYSITLFCADICHIRFLLVVWICMRGIFFVIYFFRNPLCFLFWVLSIEDFQDRFHKRKWRMPAEMLETSCSVLTITWNPFLGKGVI